MLVSKSSIFVVNFFTFSKNFVCDCNSLLFCRSYICPVDSEAQKVKSNDKQQENKEGTANEKATGEFEQGK